MFAELLGYCLKRSPGWPVTCATWTPCSEGGWDAQAATVRGT